MSLTSSIEAKLQSPHFEDKVEALEHISLQIQLSLDPLFINSIALRLADLYVHIESTNKLRIATVKDVVQKCSSILEKQVTNKEEFVSRVSVQLTSNDSQSRIITMKLLSNLPSFLQTKLDVQHQILHLLTTTNDEQERLVANESIARISSASEMFAQSIMTKVEESILSRQYSFDTCSHLINAISNVSGEASTAMIFSQTIRRVYNKMKNDTLDAVLVRALLRMTIKAPVLLDSTLQFLVAAQCLEGIEILSRQYILERHIIFGILSSHDLSAKDQGFLVMILANNQLKSRKIDQPFNTHSQQLLHTISQVSSALLSKFDEENNKFTTNYILYALQQSPATIASQLSQSSLVRVYIALIEHKQLNRLYKDMLMDIENRVDQCSFDYQSYEEFKVLFYKSQSEERHLDFQAIESLVKSNGRSIKQKTIILNNFLQRYEHKMPVETILLLLHGNKEYELLFEVLIKHASKKQHYLCLLQYLEELNLMINHQEQSVACQYLSLCTQFVRVLTSKEGLEHQIMQTQKTLMKINALIDKVEFKGKDMFEVRDPIQNDGTDDPYKHFFLHQYCQLLQQTLELTLIQEYAQGTAPDKSFDEVQQQALSQINNTIRYIRKTHSINVTDQQITSNNLQTIFEAIPHQVFKLRIPLFLNIVINNNNRDSNETVQVRRDQNFLISIHLEPSLERHRRPVTSYWVSTFLVQYHGTQFNTESSDIIQQELYSVKRGDSPIQSMLKFPSIGTYLLRVEAKLVGDRGTIGVESKRHVKFKVN